MKKFWRVILLFVVISFVVALYQQRILVMDYFRASKQPELPATVTFVEIQNKQEKDTPDTQKELLDKKTDNEIIAKINSKRLPKQIDQKVKKELPTQINLAVPFTSQAPSGNWELPFKEACEESSLLMVHEYYSGNKAKQLDIQKTEEAIIAMSDFEKAFFGYFEDTDAWQTSLLAEEYLGYAKVEVIRFPTVDEIKLHLANGHPVIIPAAGRRLHNPYFVQPGPLYHMLVLRGYTEDGFITNDPGTRHGAGYFYSYETIQNAMHDWNDGDPENGDPTILVIYPQNN